MPCYMVTVNEMFEGLLMRKVINKLKIWSMDIGSSIAELLRYIDRLHTGDYHCEHDCIVVCYLYSEDVPFMLERDLYLRIPSSEFTIRNDGTVLLHERGSYRRRILSDIDPSEYHEIEFRRQDDGYVKVIHNYTPGVPWGI